MAREQNDAKHSEPILGYYFYRILGRKLAKSISNTRITPNQITALSFLLVILSSFFYLGATYIYLIIGAATLYLSKMLDYADGELARLKNLQTKFGEWFDKYSDVYRVIIPLLAIGIGNYLQNKQTIVLVLSFVSVILFLLFALTRFLLVSILPNYKTAEFQITGKTHLGWCTPSTILIIFFSLINKPYFLLLFFSTFGALPLLIKIYTSHNALKQR